MCLQDLSCSREKDKIFLTHSSIWGTSQSVLRAAAFQRLSTMNGKRKFQKKNNVLTLAIPPLREGSPHKLGKLPGRTATKWSYHPLSKSSSVSMIFHVLWLETMISHRLYSSRKCKWRICWREKLTPNRFNRWRKQATNLQIVGPTFSVASDLLRN